MITQPAPIPIRMSSAGYCPRRQAYAALGQEPSEHSSRQDDNRKALGDAAENILIHNMLEDGWEITDTRAVASGEQLELEIDYPLPMTGHPDGICRHPEHTRNLWVTLECKSMSESRLHQVQSDGIAAVYPEYLAQVIAYSRVLYNLNRVSHPHRAVFAYMSREGDNPAPERVVWDPDTEDVLWYELTRTWDHITRRQLPPRPYEPDDPHCEYCPFYSLCHDEDPPDWRNPYQVDEPEVVKAAQDWLEADQARRKATQKLREAAAGHESGIVTGPVQASWFYPRESIGYDIELLRRRVPADVLQQCRSAESKPPAFWIRARRR